MTGYSQQGSSKAVSMLSGKSIMVTGGTGSFGKKFIATILKRYPDIRRLVVYSRDELKQFDMAQEFSVSRYPQMRYFIGDVRDKDRMRRAMERVDIVIHAAALKQVPAAEYNPFEAIKTNIIGAQNVIENAIDTGVSQVVALSTDKAAAPINLYGATKLCSDKLFVSGNNFRGGHDIRFSVVRYGNVMGSRGSVIPFFLKKRHEGVVPITDRRMTRFNITLEEGVDLVLYALTHMWGGEIFVPKIPSYRIMDLAEAVAPECKKIFIGIRPGEKLHEEMITETDALNTIEFENHYVILPSMPVWNTDEFMTTLNGCRCADNFHFSSGTNDRWLGVSELREMIQKYCDAGFTVGDTKPVETHRRRITLIRGTEDVSDITAVRSRTATAASREEPISEGV